MQKSKKAGRKSEPEYIVVVGASAGGAEVLTKLLEQLGKEMNAAFFIVMHIGGQGIDNLIVNRLRQHTDLTCQLVRAEMPVKRGHIYMAPANSHMLIGQNEVFLTHGPPENLFKPSIDVLFRSAAAIYDSKTIGIILTGMLNDGCSGLSAIQRSGGKCIVQDPHEAPYSDMPLAAINLVKPDFIISVTKMGKAIDTIMSNGKKFRKGDYIPADVTLEANLARRAVSSISAVRP